MPIEKQKLNTLNKLIDSGSNTEKKITSMGIQEIIAVPKITVPEIHIITELQDAIKSKAVIAYLASGFDEQEAEKAPKQSEKESKFEDFDETAKEEISKANDEVLESEDNDNDRFYY